MKILSLFDGISCARVGLERAGKGVINKNKTSYEDLFYK